MLEAVKKEIERLEAEIAKLKEYDPGKFFETLEEMGVERFSWTQYTPYFNDGDPCEFIVNEELIELVINGEEFDEIYDLYDYRDGERVFYKPEYEKVFDLGLMEEMKLSENLMLAIFGDHKKCTVNVSEREIKTEEHDHD